MLGDLHDQTLTVRRQSIICAAEMGQFVAADEELETAGTWAHRMAGLHRAREIAEVENIRQYTEQCKQRVTPSGNFLQI